MISIMILENFHLRKIHSILKDIAMTTRYLSNLRLPGIKNNNCHCQCNKYSYNVQHVNTNEH